MHYFVQPLPNHNIHNQDTIIITRTDYNQLFKLRRDQIKSLSGIVPMNSQACIT